jgi:hypothetical protein
MKALWRELLAIALALLLIAGVVFGLNDSSVLVPPPEAVVEGFVRQLAADRYEMALPYLSRELRAQTIEATLRELTSQLKSRTGKILNVQGEPGRVDKDQSEAAALLETASSATTRIRFKLARASGLWSITDIHELQADGLQ